MDQVVTAIITPVVESLLVPVKRHLGFLFFSTNYVTDMQSKKRELDSTSTDMKKRKEDNDVRNLKVPHHVPIWLEEAQVINREVDGISADGNGCLHIKRRYKVGKRCSNFIKRIDRLMEEKEKMDSNWTNEEKPLGRVDSATPQVLQDVTQNIFTSRKLIFQKALQLLEQDNTTQMVALCGMGGIGKTTMMEELKKVVENSKLFDHVVRVVIGNRTDLSAFQKAIADYVGGGNLSESTKEARADRLKERFLGMSQDAKKKVLIILDDLWNIVDLKDIGLASPLPKGFKLFLTSRDQTLCRQMGVETSSILRIDGLEEPEAKQLFWETMGLLDGVGDQELRKLGEDIVKRCGGLPMAIKTISLALTGKIKDAWRVTLLRLCRHDLQDLQGRDDVVYRIFKISYEGLQIVDQKIFVLSGLFPDDFDILLEDLMRYGWGLKLFDNVYSLFEARLQTNASVHNLIRANLLVESDLKGCVKMHDLARSFVLFNISEFKQASIVNHGDMSEWPTQDTRESCERILLKCKGMSEFPRHFDYPDLTLLKLTGNDYEKEPLKFRDDFYTRMKQLQVISYRSIRYPSLVPISLQCSTSLRVLCLRSCSLMGDLSSLSHLSNLEILSFAYCGIKNLPSTIGKLKNLKLLDLTGCDKLRIGDGVFQKLDNLEELYIRNLKKEVISFTEDNCEGLEMVSKKLTALEVEFFENNIWPDNVSFKKLERFRISIGCLLDPILDEDSYENTLRLVGSCKDAGASEINQLFEKTERLHLQVEDMNHVEDVLMHPSHQYSFCNLKHLSFERCANLKYLFTVSVASTLTNLERLTVKSCDVLGSLIHGETNGGEVIKFHKLKRLELEELREFVGLCDNINIVTELPQLEELRLDDLPKITCIFASSNNISATTIPLFNKQVACPKLEEMEIRGMEKLKEIWACEEEYDDRTPVLKEIAVYTCHEIQNLFPRNPMRLLSHLETLTVGNCRSNIQALFDVDSECVGQVNSSLRRIRAWGLPKLREVWRIRGDEDNSGLLVRDFKALELIEISRCENFRNIVTPTTIKFDMGALTDVTIDFSEYAWDRNNNRSEEENEILEVNDSTVAFSSSSIHNLHHVSNIKLCTFKQAEVIFDIQIPSVGILTPSEDEQPLLLPYLTNMKLIDMKSMTHLWKCNWSKFLMLPNSQQKSSFQNLTTIYVEKCKTIEYLFSPLMGTLLFNLKKVDIYDCERIQEVVSNRDDEDEESTTSTSSTSTTIILFPRFYCLTLHKLENLERIGGGIPKGTTHAINDNFTFPVPWSLGQYSREIKISSCHALSTVIPSYSAEQLQKIEMLKIYDCSSMMEVFETKELTNSPIFGQGSGGRDDTTLAAIPRLKSVTTHKMPNLKILDIEKCHRLVDIFTFSTLGSLGLLEKLSIRDCEELKVIMREEHEEQTTSLVIIFPCLKSIILADLPKIEGFFFGMNEFQLPLLDEVVIKRCPQMMVFTPLPLRAPKLKYIHINGGKYCTPECCSFFTTTTLSQTPSQSSDNTNSWTTISDEFLSYSHSLIEMNLVNDPERQVIFSYDELPQLQNLEKLNARYCKSVLEVFDIGTGVRCPNLPQTVVKLSKLRDVHLEYLESLKYIWKSNGGTILEFPNLTKLYIYGCDRLDNVFTCSMVGSLLQLKELSIRYCPDMEVIVKEDQEEEEGGDIGKVNEIIRLPCLKSLELFSLSSLKGFCLGNVDYSFPSLDRMKIEGCKSLTTFTKGGLFVPELKFIETRLGAIDLSEEQDINSFIITKTQEGFHF